MEETTNKAPFQATVLSLFPEMFPGPLGFSLAGRALERGDWTLNSVNIRDYAFDKHRSVDDVPFGGGAGMVLRPDVLDRAIRGAGGTGPLIYMTPRGRLMDQALVRDVKEAGGVRILCGRFEGVDQRVLEAHNALEVSLGDFVLSGGELPALTLLDAVVRLLPGVLGNAETLAEESFESGLLQYPHYTRPAQWEGRSVPEVLLSGHHGKIREWRLHQSQDITRTRRPDLWSRYASAKDK